MLVIGIIAGSFITSILSREFHIVLPKGKQIIKAVIGSAFMGFGALIAQGCLMGNGLVGTAQLSLKAFTSLIFITLGIWVASYIFLVRGQELRNNKKTDIS